MAAALLKGWLGTPVLSGWLSHLGLHSWGKTQPSENPFRGLGARLCLAQESQVERSLHGAEGPGSGTSNRWVPWQPALGPGTAWPGGLLGGLPLRKVSGCFRDWGMAQGQVLKEKRQLQASVMLLKLLKDQDGGLDLAFLCLHYDHGATDSGLVHLLPCHACLTLHATLFPF